MSVTAWGKIKEEKQLLRGMIVPGITLPPDADFAEVFLGCQMVLLLLHSQQSGALNVHSWQLKDHIILLYINVQPSANKIYTKHFMHTKATNICIQLNNRCTFQSYLMQFYKIMPIRRDQIISNINDIT